MKDFDHLKLDKKNEKKPQRIYFISPNKYAITLEPNIEIYWVHNGSRTTQRVKHTGVL